MTNTATGRLTLRQELPFNLTLSMSDLIMENHMLSVSKSTAGRRLLRKAVAVVAPVLLLAACAQQPPPPPPAPVQAAPPAPAPVPAARG